MRALVMARQKRYTKLIMNEENHQKFKIAVPVSEFNPIIRNGTILLTHLIYILNRSPPPPPLNRASNNVNAHQLKFQTV
jgi:hypothetical protein